MNTDRQQHQLSSSGSDIKKIGGTLKMQEAIALFAKEGGEFLTKLINKSVMKMPVLNQSGRTAHNMKDLPKALADQFRFTNELDYLVYEYCLHRYEELRSRG